MLTPNLGNHVKDECDKKWLYGSDSITDEIMLTSEFYPGAKEFLIDLMNDPNMNVIFITNTFFLNI